MRRFNGGVECDTEEGPCACGAWHKREETMSNRLYLSVGDSGVSLEVTGERGPTVIIKTSAWGNLNHELKFFTTDEGLRKLGELFIEASKCKSATDGPEYCYPARPIEERTGRIEPDQESSGDEELGQASETLLGPDWVKFVANNSGHETWIHKDGYSLQKRGKWHLSHFKVEIASAELDILLKAVARGI